METSERMEKIIIVGGEEKSRVRALRSDAGKIRLQPRDFEALAWLSEMRAISEPDLGVLLGQLVGKAPLAVGGVRPVVKRWLDLGLVSAERVLARQSRVVMLTRKGAQTVGEQRWSEPKWTSLPHYMAVSRARLWLELVMTSGTVREWESELAYRRRQDSAIKQGLHVPDAVITLVDDRRVAVEVERSVKTVSRTAAIINDLRRRHTFDAVMYVVEEAPNQQVERTVRAGIDQSYREYPEAKNPITVRVLPTDLAAVINEERSRSEH